ncbi:hypothetical protein BGZ83_005647 [Gryganskiella cystojenkinii]|nr:hypothetical protein BGZ83_005647 [Gryganskiella cystojenkinii]
MTKVDAISIPEVVTLIGSQLDRLTLTQCIRVSKFFHRVLTPLLYQTITDKHPTPSLEALSKYGFNIRSLTVSLHGPSRQSADDLSLYSTRIVHCQNLNELELNFQLCNAESHDPWHANTLVSLNQRLRILRIRDRGHFPTYRPCWGPMLSQCSQLLQELSLKSICLQAKDTDLFLRHLAPFLVKVKFVDCRFLWSGTFTERPQFPRLKEIFVENDLLDATARELEWVNDAPLLNSWTWTKVKTQGFEKRVAFNRLLESNIRTQSQPTFRFTCLQTIDCSNHTTCLTDAQVSLMLNACTLSLKSLNVSGSLFWYRSLFALERHFRTLERFEARFCTQLRGWMTVHILASCARLIKFCGGVIYAHDLVKGRGAEEARLKQARDDFRADIKMRQEEAIVLEHKNESDPTMVDRLVNQYKNRASHLNNVVPWLCLKMHRLETSIVFTSRLGNSKGWDAQIFAILAKLTRLRFLHLTTTENWMTGVRGLCFDLPSGLAQLSDLKELRTLDLGGTAQELDKEDLVWMMNQWPKLKRMSQNLNMDKTTNQKLRRIADATRSIHWIPRGPVIRT